MVDVIVMDAVVDRVLELDRGVAPTGELVVVDLCPVVALDEDANRGVDAVAAIVSVILDAVVGVLGRALSSISPDYSEPCMMGEGFDR